MLGVHPSLFHLARARTERGDITPAIWYKLRADRLVDADRECVFLIRQIGANLNELEEVTQRRTVGWQVLFSSIRQKVDIQAPPRQQGRQAARMFRESSGLGHGHDGIGAVLRGNLRSIGILVVESPVPESALEGCSFYVGSDITQRPCIFANTHHVTWFRRNVVLAHELGHAIFDAENTGAALDFQDNDGANDLPEERAQAFAQELLLPPESLRHLAQARGVQWGTVTQVDLAQLVAASQVELNLVLGAAVDAGLMPLGRSKDLRSSPLDSLLRELTDHALSTKEYLRTKGSEATPLLVGNRTTTIPSRRIRLPVSYVAQVLQACRDSVISDSKAAELLMIDEFTFESRFGEFMRAA